MTYTEAMKFLAARGIERKFIASTLFYAENAPFAVIDGLFIDYDAATKTYTFS
jgi:hypothetical protein